MEFSKFLSKAIGLYIVIVSLALISNLQQFDIKIINLIHDSSLMLVTGFFTLVVGILMVVSHNIWERSWRVMVTIVAWLTLLKALTIIFCPALIENSTTYFVIHDSVAYTAGIIDLCLGGMFCYFGFRQ